MSNYTTLFQDVTTMVQWLDRHNVLTQEEMGLRIMKVQEEAGEAAGAWIGYTGQNPRKGRTHDKEQVAAELVDVAVTAMVALQSLTGGKAESVLNLRLSELRRRTEHTNLANLESQG